MWIEAFLGQSITNWAQPAVCWLYSHLVVNRGACMVTLIDLIIAFLLSICNKLKKKCIVGSDYLCIHNAIYCTLGIHHDVIFSRHHSTNSFKEGKIRTCRLSIYCSFYITIIAKLEVSTILRTQLGCQWCHCAWSDYFFPHIGKVFEFHRYNQIVISIFCHIYGFMCCL